MLETDYDRVPYQSNPYDFTHPDHLAVMARLMGLESPPPEGARVLELGCGAGGNLLPMAASMPRARFVGVDLAPSAIAHASRGAQLLGLDNVEFRAMSIADIDASFGAFDYILCHGVYSWVPGDVREAILRVCREHLTERGVAYISYNCLPGWSFRGAMREVMRFHTQSLESPGEKVAQGRAILGFLVENTPPASEWGHLLRGEKERLDQQTDWYVFHDSMAPVNQGFWFHEFARDADAAGLEYLADAMFSTMMVDNFPEPVREALAGLNGDLIRTEQYLDFVRCRYFRQSLVVRKGAPVDRHIDGSRLHAFRFTTRAIPEGDIDLTEGVPMAFKAADGLEITSQTTLIKAALVELFLARPAALSFEDLFARAARHLPVALTPEEARDARHTLAGNLLSCLSTSMVVPSLWERPYLSTVSLRPRVFSYARLQAANGALMLTNLRHEGAKVDPLERELVVACDGTRDRDGLIDALIDALTEGRLVVEGEDGPIADPRTLRREIGRAVDSSMLALMRMALLDG